MGNANSALFSKNLSPFEEKREEIFQEDEQEIVQRSEESRSKSDTENSFYDDSDTTEENGDETDTGASLVDPSLYQYPFENIIFEGGGNKGLAYSGSVKCLEDMNILRQIKRVGGSSAGAITAALVAIGYGSQAIFEFMTENVERIFLDHSYGYLSLLPNLIRGWGWNPGQRIYQWLGEKIEAKTGDPNLTFFELYKLKGIELCVVVTNLNQMRPEYCHPKTTPNMAIRDALRMSMSIPVVFMACVHDNNGQKDTYVDGGVLCNYPIQCFDGWYLSMEKNDSFLLHMQNLDDLSQLFSIKNMFQHDSHKEGLINQKTLGFLLYDDTEVEVMKDTLEQRKGVLKPTKPSRSTKLYKRKVISKNIQTHLIEERKRCQKAAEAFMKSLHKYNIEDEIHIDKEELRRALEDESSFSSADRDLLFGKNISVDEAFHHLDKDGNGQIDFQELLRFLEKRNIRIQTRIQGYGRTVISSLFEFGTALQNSWTTNLKFLYFGDNDIKRTVGINTGHVGTCDYVLEDEDRQFLIDRGYNSTMAFLRYFIEDNAEQIVKKATGDADVTKTVQKAECISQHLGNDVKNEAS